MNESAITVTTEINVDIDKVWALWTSPEHITQWNTFSPAWHCPVADNDARTGGRFKYVMAMKDGSFSFDFEGTYDEVVPKKYIKYTLDDGRRAENTFSGRSPVKLVETFEPDGSIPSEDQRQACHSVIDNFKRYAESLG